MQRPIKGPGNTEMPRLHVYTPWRGRGSLSHLQSSGVAGPSLAMRTRREWSHLRGLWRHQLSPSFTNNRREAQEKRSRGRVKPTEDSSVPSTTLGLPTHSGHLVLYQPCGLGVIPPLPSFTEMKRLRRASSESGAPRGVIWTPIMGCNPDPSLMWCGVIWTPHSGV